MAARLLPSCLLLAPRSTQRVTGSVRIYVVPLLLFLRVPPLVDAASWHSVDIYCMVWFSARGGLLLRWTTGWTLVAFWTAPERRPVPPL